YLVGRLGGAALNTGLHTWWERLGGAALNTGLHTWWERWEEQH
ncbi:hypothetical protein HMPREF9989_03429, partial [Staphylococcus epidermidis NIHLM057]